MMKIKLESRNCEKLQRFSAFFLFFGRMRLKKHSEKIDDVRPKMEQIQRKRGRASSCRKKKISPLPFELIINAAQ